MSDSERWSHFVWWKKRLMADLDKGVLERDEWKLFVREADKAGMACMADSMQKRLNYYGKKTAN